VTGRIDVRSLRASEFPWAESSDVVYLNSASTGPLPERTAVAVDRFTRRRTQPHLITDAEQRAILARSRELIARLVNASEGEIAVATNTGFGINLAALALPLDRGDVVVVPGLEFPANMYPWMSIMPRRGVELRVVPPRDGLIDESAIFAALDQPRVRALSVAWVGFSTGARVNLRKLGRACRERGIFFIVDAIQGLGALTIDLADTPVDIFACGAQKWLLSPWGTGFTYIRRELIERLEPPTVSWAAVAGSDDYTRLLDYDLTWRDDARRFELITLPYQDFVGLNGSLSLLFELGPEAVSTHICGLVERGARRAADRRIRSITPADEERRAGILSLASAEPEAASRRLGAAGVIHSLRDGAIRLSPHIFNTEEEIDRAVDLLVG
jgi:cysteine desulfurase / selenocysteine lyase